MYTTKQQKPQQSRVIHNRLSSSIPKTIQKQTIVFEQRGQPYSWFGHSTEVGKVVEVGLDPWDMIQGQSADLNNAQDYMMDAIRYMWGISGGNVVKGHLWNDNLGGCALNNNLFPITKAANSDHLYYVENRAKTYVFNRVPIYYKVEVDAYPDITEPIAEFDCEIRKWSPYYPYEVGDLLVPPITIRSDLRDVGAYREAYETYTGSSLEREKRPKFPKWLKHPKTRVRELTKEELFWRNLQQPMIE